MMQASADVRHDVHNIPTTTNAGWTDDRDWHIGDRL